MSPEQLLRFSLGFMVFLAVAVLIIFVFLLVKKKSANPDLPPDIPDNPLDLIENLLLCDPHAKKAEATNSQNIWITYLKSYQSDQDVDLLSILVAYTKFYEEKTAQSLDGYCKILDLFKKSHNVKVYYDYYSQLSVLLNMVETEEVSYGSDLNFKNPVSFFQNDRTVSNKKKNLRKIIYNLLNNVFPVLLNLSKYLTDVSMDNTLKEQYLKLADFKKNIKDCREQKIFCRKNILTIENKIVMDTFDFIIEAINECLDKYSNQFTVSNIESVLTLEPKKLVMAKNNELSLQLNVTNTSQFLCDEVFINIKANEGYKISEGSFGKTRLGNLPANKSIRYGFILHPDVVNNEMNLEVEIGCRHVTGELISSTVPIQISLKDPTSFFTESPYQTFPKNRRINFFVGRKAMIKKISRIILSKESGQIIGIFGLARMGKTALLFELIEREEIHRSTIFVYFNLDDLSINPQNWFNRFLELLFNKIKNNLEKAGFHPPNINRSDNMAVEIVEFLEKLQPELERKGKNIVLVIDEYHRIEENTTPNIKNEKEDIIRLFKQIAFNIPKISLILSGYHDLYTIQRYDNFWNDTLGKGFESFKVSFLTKEESISLMADPMAKYGIRYEDKLPEYIYDITRGYPWYIQLFCDKLFEYIIEQREKTITLEHVENVKNEILSNDLTDTYFTHIFSAEWADSITEGIVQIIAIAPDEIVYKEDGLKYVPRKYILEQLHHFGLTVKQGTLILKIESLSRKDVLTTRDISGEQCSAIQIVLLAEWYSRKSDIEGTLAKINDPLS